MSATAQKAKVPAAKDGAKSVEKKKVGKPRNYDLGSGVYRFSRTKMFHKTARYKFIGKKTEPKKREKVASTIVKKINGDKNGETRVVLRKKRPAYYPTADKINKHPTKKRFREHVRHYRKSLQPGKVVILLAGRHKGKRVILLKILKSGLLLVTGPFSVNGCPLRRISPNYVIATDTQVDISEVKIPKQINDAYFKRSKPLKEKKTEGDIFAKKVTGYVVKDERKANQKIIDKAVLVAIKKRLDKRLFKKYLGAMFGLKRTQYPHRMKF